MSLGWGNSGHQRTQLTRFLCAELTSGCLVLSLDEGKQRLPLMLLSAPLFYLSDHTLNELCLLCFCKVGSEHCITN